MRWGRARDASAQTVSVTQAGMPGGSWRPWSPAPHAPPREDSLGGPIRGAAALTYAAKPPSTFTAPIHSSTLLGQRLHPPERESKFALSAESWQEMGHLRRPQRPLPTGAAELGLPGDRQAQQVPVHVESRVEG